MKRLLILTVLGVLLSGAIGCRFMECLWRGPACQQNTAPAVTYVNPCPAPSSCDSCTGGPAVVSPGPETYTPQTPGR
jgi:hypothetical protein